ncbi:Condensin-2 complex subunit G2 [Pteropus alecto]|uniref:Condensin-2 complex subunit G2 n=1 Tax=Pteropus alecto TaxID=9402 RepID=L5L6Z7_PTEAL|nr:Condensin-2 complex subunit G2 [Pteropus alecto]
MEKRETFVQAVSKELIGEFLQFVQLDEDASDPFNLNELLDELSRKQKEELWRRLRSLLTDVLLESPVDGWQTEEDLGEDDMETDHDSKTKKSIEIIRAITSVILASVSVINESENYEALLECAVILNGVLYALPASERKLQGSIQDLCVTWWERGLPAKEDMGKTAFVMLLRRSLETKTGADICRLWRIHQALYCFDYDLEESREIKNMLLECFINVNYIKKEETIEHGCIQDFMYHGIHLQRRSPVHPRVREARNSEVRSNAALLFVEAFPVRDPNFNAIEMDSEIQKQFEELYSLLEDPYPMVRSTGILGVCKITSKYWEMMPPTILIDLLKKVTGELAFDTSSADVRCSVFKCLPILLDNKLSHPLLEQLLPAVKYSLHDNSEKVRVAFVDMLLKVKAVRAAKFWKICPMEHILARLASDSRPVSRRLVSLIFNSFLPVNQPEEVWCERCVTLLQMNRAAARKFYQYAHEHTACTNIAKLIHVIRHCLNACIRKAIRESQEDGEEREKEDVSVLDKTLSVHDAASMAGLLEVVVILWKSIHRNMESNKEARGYTVGKFASVLPEYLKVFQVPALRLGSGALRGPSSCISTPCTAARVPSASPRPSHRCCGREKSRAPFLRVLEPPSKAARDSVALEPALGSEVGGALRAQRGAWSCTLGCPGSDTAANAASNSASKRKVRIHDTRPVKPELALIYMEYLLTHPKNRECLLSAPHKKLNHLLKALDTSKVDLESILQSPDGKPQNFTEATALRAFSLHCRLSIHLQHKFCSEGKVYLSILEDTGFWLESKVLSFIQDQEEEYLKLRRVIYQEIIQTPLHDFITTVQSWHEDTPLHRSVLSILIAASVVEISHQLRKVTDVEELTPPERLSDLPPFSRCLIGIIIKSPNVVRSYLDELKASVTSDDIEGIVCLTAIMHIILVINKGKHKSSKVKDVAATVHRKLKTFMEITLEEDSMERSVTSHTRHWPHSGPHCPERICLVTPKPHDLPSRERSLQAQAERRNHLGPAPRSLIRRFLWGAPGYSGLRTAVCHVTVLSEKGRAWRDSGVSLSPDVCLTLRPLSPWALGSCSDVWA